MKNTIILKKVKIQILRFNMKLFLFTDGIGLLLKKLFLIPV